MIYLAIAFMIGIDLVMWLIIRAYERNGVVLGFPWSIHRDRTPRWFRFNIVALRVSLWLCIAFTAIMSLVLIFSVQNA